MKGYIYITGTGTDPGLKGNLNDPILSRRPSLGACMPNIRRLVTRGDHIFVVSGSVSGAQQYVVGGFRVEDKLDALAAYERFPENRLQLDSQGIVQGNIIINADGTQHALDHHDPASFEDRIKNYIVGSHPVALTTLAETALSRLQTLDKLATILQKPKANRVIDVMGRWARLNQDQVKEMLDWLRGIKLAAR